MTDINRVLLITTLNINHLINPVKDTPHNQREATLSQGWKISLKAKKLQRKQTLLL